MSAIAPTSPDRQVSEMRSLIASGKRKQVIFAAAGVLCTAFAVLVLLAAFLNLLIDGLPRLSWSFLTSFPSRRASEAGILSAWVGSAMVMLVTMFAAVPIGVGAAVYLEEYAKKNWVTDLIEINVTNLAGVPSIVFGLLALGLFVYQFGFGESVLTAGLALALLILPIVVVSSREALRTVPNHIREAAYAMGATRWQMVRGVVLRRSWPGVIAAVVLGLSRALGETMAVLMVVGNAPHAPRSIFDAAYPLTALIANNYGEMMSIPLYDAALLGGALILLVIVLIFNLASRLILVRLVKSE